VAIHLPLQKLSQWQRIAFSATLLERMLPNYQMFSEGAEFGEYKVLRNQLDLIWQRLNKAQKVKINYDVQLIKLEEQIPDPECFDFFGVYPALDAAMSLMSLLQAMQDNEGEGFESISRLSENSVNFYAELCLAQEINEQSADEEIEITGEMIKAHPLVQWEKEMQNELFDFIKAAPENNQSCASMKSIALEQGLSNLGIEF